ncbi:MAG: tRNA (adenosine(37)-N6)-dimethylallyltransferase MiaA [Candidatus Marsarchaeota archaeon]|nr:tRNA (adenosine(37)-N6)-dimethylallyltransferase MiaA [Candidatus Marsarchaeota archaeon]
MQDIIPPVSSLLALIGPTASGKTTIATELASQFKRLELVSIDSMTVYRSMDIGTAKPRGEELKAIHYHLLDMADPWEEYSVSRFQTDVRNVLDEIAAHDGIALLVGGTGLYYQAVVDGLEIPGQWPQVREELEEVAASGEGLGLLYRRLAELDSDAAGKIEPNNRRRIVRALEVTLGSGVPFSRHGPGLFANRSNGVRAVGIDLPRAELFDRIEKRLDILLTSGWVEEVQRIASDPRGMSRTARQALGYKEILAHLEGHASLDEVRLEILARTKRFAKRQVAWFRRDPRIAWFSSSEGAKMELASIVSGIVECPSS